MFGAGKILARSATPAPNMGEGFQAVRSQPIREPEPATRC
jgi:hypothetical protein